MIDWREEKRRRRRREELNFGGGGRSRYIDMLLNTESANLVGLFVPSMSGITDLGPNAFSVTPSNVIFGSSTVMPGVEAARYVPADNSYTNIYSAAFQNPNLLTNGGFETAGAGGADIWANWSENAGDGALANETVLIHEGADAAKLTQGASFNTTITQTAITVVPGIRYRLRFYTRGDGTNAGSYRIFDNTNGADIVGVTTTGVAGTTYTMVAKEFTAPAGCISIFIRFYGPAVNGAVSYWDAVEVRRADRFLGDEGTLLAWAKVSAAGVWTDGVVGRIMSISVDANNYVLIEKGAGANTVQFLYKAGGTSEGQATGSHSPMGYVPYAITWSAAGDAVKYYISGAASGATDTGLGTWTGNLASNSVVIGATTTTPTSPFSGDIGPVAIWSKALTAAQIAAASII